MFSSTSGYCFLRLDALCDYLRLAHNPIGRLARKSAKNGPGNAVSTSQLPCNDETGNLEY